MGTPSGGASCRILYQNRKFPGRSAGVNFPKDCASARETGIFSDVSTSPGAERCLIYTHPSTEQKKTGFRGLCNGHTDNADRWLCVSLSNKAQFAFGVKGVLIMETINYICSIFPSAIQTFNGG